MFLRVHRFKPYTLEDNKGKGHIHRATVEVLEAGRMLTVGQKRLSDREP